MRLKSITFKVRKPLHLRLICITVTGDTIVCQRNIANLAGNLIVNYRNRTYRYVPMYLVYSRQLGLQL